MSLLLARFRKSRQRNNFGSKLRDKRPAGHVDAVPAFDPEQICGAPIAAQLSRRGVF
jgi:hypothetical protein